MLLIFLQGLRVSGGGGARTQGRAAGLSGPPGGRPRAGGAPARHARLPAPARPPRPAGGRPGGPPGLSAACWGPGGRGVPRAACAVGVTGAARRGSGGLMREARGRVGSPVPETHPREPQRCSGTPGWGLHFLLRCHRLRGPEGLGAWRQARGVRVSGGGRPGRRGAGVPPGEARPGEASRRGWDEGSRTVWGPRGRAGWGAAQAGTPERHSGLPFLGAVQKNVSLKIHSLSL